MKIKIVTLVLASFVVIAACKKKDDNCNEEKLTAAFIFDYPDTVNVNAVFTLNVNYVVDNSCGEFGEFEAEKFGNVLEVKLKTNYVGCNCDDEFEEKSASYPIAFTDPGVYELKFWIAENEFESYSIVAID